MVWSIRQPRFWSSSSRLLHNKKSQGKKSQCFLLNVSKPIKKDRLNAFRKKIWKLRQPFYEEILEFWKSGVPYWTFCQYNPILINLETYWICWRSSWRAWHKTPSCWNKLIKRMPSAAIRALCRIQFKMVSLFFSEWFTPKNSLIS